MGLPEILALVAVLGVVLVIVVTVRTVRRVRLLRRGGVDIVLRRRCDDTSGRGWHHGVGRYRGDELHWYWVASLRTGPDVVVERTDLEIVDRRSVSPAEVYAVPATSTVLCCRGARATWEFAMEDDVLTGFRSWLESIPPGRSTGYHQAS